MDAAQIDLSEFVEEGSIMDKEFLVQKLKKKNTSLNEDMETLMQEHNNITASYKSDDMESWINSFPVENLDDSLTLDLGKDLEKLSISDLKERAKIRNKHDEAAEELLVNEHKIKAAEADVLQAIIKDVLS